MFNLMNTGSGPKIPFGLHEPVRMMGYSICRTGFNPQGLHDFPHHPPDDQSGILACWVAGIKI